MINKLLIIAAAFLLFISCGERSKAPEEIKIVYVDWAEGTAITYLIENILEERLNYDVALKLTDVENAFRLTSEGEYDLFADAWLPETHKRYMEKYGDSLEDLGSVYTDARTGFVAPVYSGFDNITDLNNNLVNEGKIFGIDTLAGISIAGQKAISEYGLNYELVNAGSKQMMNILDSLYKRREEVVITGWRPHWMMEIYDLKFLKDPKDIFGKQENIHAVARLNFKETHPDLVEFFNEFRLTNEQINSLMYEISIAARPEEGVRKWSENNSILVNKWTHGLRIKRNFN